VLPFFETYFDRLQMLHADIHRVFDGLPQEAIDWSPGDGMNSLAVLVTHTAGAMRYWIGTVAGQDQSERDRDSEFRTKDDDAAALGARIDAALVHSRTILGTLTLADLDAKRIAPRDGRVYTVAWALMHALEHTAIHVGHMQMAWQLWDQRRT